MEVRGGKVKGVDIGELEGIVEETASSSFAGAYGDEPYAPLLGRNTSTRICAVVSKISWIATPPFLPRE